MEEFRRVTGKQVEEFLAYLVREEKSERTVEKYGRDVRAFCAFLPVGKRWRRNGCWPIRSTWLRDMRLPA